MEKKQKKLSPEPVETQKTSAATLVSLSALKEQAAGLQRAQLLANLAHVITAPDGSFESWSETLPRLVGVDPDNVVGSTRKWLDLIHPEDRPRFRDTALNARAEGKKVEVEYRLWRRDGSWVYVRQVMEPIAGPADSQGRLRWFNTLQDITAQKLAEAKIKRLNRVHAVLSGINSLIVRVRDRQSLFDEACELAVKHGNFRLAWIGLVDRAGNRVTRVASAGDVRDFFTAERLSLAQGTAAFGLAGRAIRDLKPAISQDLQRDPVSVRKKDYESRGINSLCALPLISSGIAVGVIALYAPEVGFFDDEEMKLLLELAGDIAFAMEHIEKSEKARYLAYYDPLTGLANRTLFHERLEQALRGAKRDKRRAAVVVMDLERFRTVNESFGRQAGDDLLKLVTERLTANAREADWCGRLGADQYAIVVPDVTSDEELARRTEERLVQMFASPYRIGGHELRISGKLGIAVFPSDAPDADALLRNAEAALKKAKKAGEQFLFYEQRMTERVSERLALENKLRQALEKEEFILHYQPRVDLDSREIRGVEALLRWQSPELGLVPPLKFIGLLEETGMILQVGSWAMRHAALAHQAWTRAGLQAPRIAVNVSAIQLRQRNFVRLVEEAISAGILPTAIDLEITESLLMEDIEANIGKLKSVRELGLSFSIDDFGTGYSSLAYLAKLPVQALKIDRSFITSMQDDPNAMTLVSTMISLAHSLKLKVVAEGVETEEQAKILRLLRCDEMQGYLFSKPLPAEALMRLLAPAPA